MEHSKPAPVPLSSSINLESQDGKLLNRQDHEAYRRLIEKLIFIATGTRIDIAFAVNYLSQHFSESREIHLQAVKHILRYLTGITNLGILYRATAGDFIIYANAAYAYA